MLTLPNLITLARLAAIVPLGWLLAAGRWEAALLLFLLCAAGDGLDGFLARRLHQESRLGALLDPVADKLTMLTVALLLAWHGLLPWWLAAAVVLRDVVIFSGATAYRLRFGALEIAPTRLSKLNTFLEFGTLALVLANDAGWLVMTGYLPLLFAVMMAMVVLSGGQYVWLWSGKAARTARAARRARRGADN
jgi:cardiolipin synthase